MDEKINQTYGAYYPPELDENLQIQEDVFSENLKNSQKTPDFLHQNASKSEKTENFDPYSAISALLGNGENTLSKVMALKNKSLPEAISMLAKNSNSGSNSGSNSKTEKTQKPTIVEV